MPTFCRHNRLADRCPICSRAAKTATGPVGTGASAARRSAGPRPPRTGKPRTPRAADLRVTRLSRAVEDGYISDLVPGLRASGDARRLAGELAFSAARLEELASAPPGLLAEIRALEDREEATWWLFLVAWIGVAEDTEDPWASIRAAHVPWATGGLPDVAGVAGGPRGALEPARADTLVTAWRRFVARAGGSQVTALAGDASAEPRRRFDRAFERLALPGFGRQARLELLVLADRLGLVGMDPWTLQWSAASATDPVLLAGKRIFGIGDAVNLGRRASELAAECGLPPVALDLALWNWQRAPGMPQARAGATVDADPDVRERIATVLGVAEPAAGDDEP